MGVSAETKKIDKSFRRLTDWVIAAVRAEAQGSAPAKSNGAARSRRTAAQAKKLPARTIA